MIEVLDRGGVFLPGTGFWLDPPRARARAFVSHAHSDHFAEHAEIICSGPTRALVETRFPRKRHRVVREPCWGERFEVGAGHWGELLPAGHVLGSAMLRVVRERDGASLLYTGDFKLRPGLTAEPAELPRADVLVMETTFGRPLFRFPPEDETAVEVVRFAGDAVAAGGPAVLLAYSLGKAQEALALLDGAGLPVMAHASVAAVTEVYRRLRPAVPLPELLPLDPAAARGHVVVCPPGAAAVSELRCHPGSRVAVLTGWAMQRGARFRYGADLAIPLSDHAGYDDLLRAVEAVNPQRVFTVHGYAREFAADLRARGWDAWSLAGGDQVEFDFGPRS
jgi:DNA ligase-1